MRTGLLLESDEMNGTTFLRKRHTYISTTLCSTYHKRLHVITFRVVYNLVNVDRRAVVSPKAARPEPEATVAVRVEI